ncbi:MAG: riboflavin synthase [Bacteroidales bacterium]|jgi:riboflavin synthase|nr:riboflavin synthase [Bacteroidales bacterium]MDD3756102.1 riboflavin synthase [Bacteroidales bacterium]MDI9576211.1 riboflavin synthase [Bacteroidota bacterium]MDY0401208.1 riboflavin synthase [Bacteroidales bacterium]HHW58825.1 riboflavin synthase [Bacteroidales bacterium]
MFSGIIEQVGRVTKVEREGTNIHFTIKAPMASDLKIDQSVCHDGVCLTVVWVDKKNLSYRVTAIDETLNRTCLKNWKDAYEVNLERSVPVNGRFDGHIVQGHVDQIGIVTKIEELDGSWKYFIEYNPTYGNITVEKGSIAVNGVSLTVVDSIKNLFSVAIIPYTYENTNFHNFDIGTIVNLEFDIIGKYIKKILEEYEIIK